MKHYRVYALIHGQILPEGEFSDCKIEKMSFKEQSARKFTPLKGEFTDDMTCEYKTYVTSLPYLESLKIKAEYVAIHDLKESSSLAALGGGIRAFEKLCRYLFIANAEDINMKFKGKIGYANTYLYQVVKIYEVDSDGKECEVEYKIQNGHVFLPNRPDANNWRDTETESFLDEILSFNDDTFKRSLDYLYKSSVGHFILDSSEKIALDHFKSIEIIVNSLSNKQKFLDRLQKTVTTIGLTKDEKDQVVKLWKDRSNGDVAHSKEFGMSDRYPNQFPIPINTEYPGSSLGSVAEMMCLKYYHYKKNIFNVEIDYDEDATNEGTLGTFNAMWKSNHLMFHIKKYSNDQLIKKLKVKFISKFGFKDQNIDIKKIGKNTFVIDTNN